VVVVVPECKTKKKVNKIVYRGKMAEISIPKKERTPIKRQRES
jgi:hypothetical protein